MLAASSSKTAMNSLPMILRFCSGSSDARQPGEEAVAGVHGDHPQAKLVAHVLLHLQELVLAQHAVVDKDTGQAVADGARHQHRGHGGIDPAGKSADGVAIPHLRADAATVDWMNCSGVQSGCAWQMSKRKLRSSSVPRGVWRTSG